MPPLILITRPQAASEAFAADLSADLGSEAEICIAPLMEIAHMDALPDLAPYHTFIFTSAHAVAAFAAGTPRRDFTCYAVGTATADAARDAGFDPVTGPGTGKTLAAQILRDAPAGPCLYLRGDHVAFDMAEALNMAGLETHEAMIYAQRPRPLPNAALERISKARTLIAPVFSPRSAQLLLDALPKDASLAIAAISEAAAGVVPPARAARIRVADAPEKAAMLRCVAALWRDANELEGGSTAQ